MFLDDVYKEYMYEIQIKNYSERTIKGYKNNLNKFFNYCKSEHKITELEEINHIHIKQYLNFLKGRNLSETYINTILKNIRSFYTYCYKEEYCLNVAKKVSCLKENKVIIQTFTDSEVRKMLDAYRMDTYINARNKCIVALLIDTGIRNSELCGITRLDVKDTVIHILGKVRKERIVPISPMLKKIMIKYERIRDMYLKDNILSYNNYFLSYRCRPLTVEAIERVLKIAGERARVRDTIRCSPHTCRHYFAQTQLRNGLDIYSLSRLLGHETVDITKRYLQSIKDEKIIEMSISTSPLMNLRR
ncbi:tyrosine recombinase XerC [[Clostridium] sordellii]|uniref:tyrosine-type recombinase/integrase n=1 Tax=Paraclostridium sordellii TaxID=1505 RepID=UPI0005E4054B|nr:tyrosine-type recombinase/integrase [Paeniclostridium sordellii]MDU2148622.1 tyrosine-type recombinase/integrase [Paeniclostridium sordellii]CEQ31857.1 tyrosine recombinase XerC [[Clostridium] sordellii] [Paeniclostridium sordellii]